jgi:hypothetical protein
MNFDDITFDDIDLEVEVGDTPEVNTREAIIERVAAGEKTLSYSALMAFAKSPRNLMAYWMRTVQPTDAMIYGSMVHCLILTPELFEQKYFSLNDAEIVAQIGGGNPRGTKAYKEWKAEEMAKAEGKEVVDGKTMEAALYAQTAINFSMPAKRLLESCEYREVPVDWEYGGYAFKGVIDASSQHTIVDLKSMRDAEPKAVQRKIVDMGYHIQAALYRESMGYLPYFIIAFDRNGGVSTHELHDNLIKYGLEKVDMLLEGLNRCIKNNLWHKGYDFWAEREDGIFIAERPAWTY